MVTRGGVTRTLKPKVKPKLEYHSSLATCIPYIPFFHLDTILIDRVIAIQISGPFGEIVTLSFDL